MAGKQLPLESLDPQSRERLTELLTLEAEAWTAGDVDFLTSRGDYLSATQKKAVAERAKEVAKERKEAAKAAEEAEEDDE